MKTLNYAAFKELPVQAKVLWTIALVFALVGMALLVLDMFELLSVRLWISLLIINVSLWINVFCLRKYRDRMYS